MANSAKRDAVEVLQGRYALALDRRDMAGWLGCFASDGSYLCQSRENYERRLPIGFMWDDRYTRLQDRVKTVNEVWKGTAEEYQSRHLVQTLAILESGAGVFEVTSNFVVFATNHRGDSQMLATGEYVDRIRIKNDIAELVMRCAILDQVVVPRYLVYPI